MSDREFVRICELEAKLEIAEGLMRQMVSDIAALRIALEPLANMDGMQVAPDEWFVTEVHGADVLKARELLGWRNEL